MTRNNPTNRASLSRRSGFCSSNQSCASGRKTDVLLKPLIRCNLITFTRDLQLLQQKPFLPPVPRRQLAGSAGFSAPSETNPGSLGRPSPLPVPSRLREGGAVRCRRLFAPERGHRALSRPPSPPSHAQHRAVQRQLPPRPVPAGGRPPGAGAGQGGHQEVQQPGNQVRVALREVFFPPRGRPLSLGTGGLASWLLPKAWAGQASSWPRRKKRQNVLYDVLNVCHLLFFYLFLFLVLPLCADLSSWFSDPPT